MALGSQSIYKEINKWHLRRVKFSLATPKWQVQAKSLSRGNSNIDNNAAEVIKAIPKYNQYLFEMIIENIL